MKDGVAIIRKTLNIPGEVSSRTDQSTRSVAIIDPTADERWDSFVNDHPFGWICHLSVWKQILEECFDHMKGYYLVVLNNGAIESALPLFRVKRWFTENGLVSIPFATLSDPLISSPEDMNRLFESAVELSNELDSPCIEIRTSLSPPIIQDTNLEMLHYYKHHYIPLNDEPGKLIKSFHRTCVRERISKASRNDLKLRVGENIEDLKSFYKLFLMTRKRVYLPPHPFVFIKTLWERLSPSGKLSLLLAEHNDLPIAGMILFKFKGRVSVEYAVSDKTYWKLCPNQFIFWEAIKLSYHEGFKIFDLGRTSPDNHSLLDFKRRWGTTVVDLPVIYHPAEMSRRRGEKERTAKYKLLKKICSITPRPFYHLLGKLFYNG